MGLSTIINKIKKIFNKIKITLVDFFCYFKLKNSLAKNNQEQIDLDKKLVCSMSKTIWPSFAQLKYASRYLTFAELWIIRCCLLIILISSIFIGTKFYIKHQQNLPAKGGEYIEGMVGAPKYLSPLYASANNTDSDIVFLVFSSLFKRGKNGELINDLVENYEVSPDGKNYTIKIKSNVRFHNNRLLTANDIVFTFNAIKNAQYKSPLRISFTGVELEVVDDKTIKFILSEPYAGFLDLLIFGILPEELWQQINPVSASLAELNLKPIGSGAYKFKSLIKDKSGNIRSYTLIKNSNYYNQIPFIDKITFKFFNNWTELISGLNNNLINGISYLPAQNKNEVVAQNSLNFFQLRLPQLTAIFFNSKSNIALSDKKVRQALLFALDKNKIAAIYGEQDALVIDGPILPENFAYNANVKKYNYDIATATKLLDEAGWKIVKISQEEIDKAKSEINSADQTIKKKAETKIFMGVGEWRAKGNDFLTIKLITVDAPEYVKTAEEIAKFWQIANIKTIIAPVQNNKVQSEIIRQRTFDALLYSEMVNADPDPYAFWHSSQIGQTGLNIADYNNKEVDKLLEDARSTNDINSRREKYNKFQEIIAEEQPAIFLYSPNYTYALSKRIKGFSVKNILMPQDRFVNINEWYMKTIKKIVW